MNSLPAAILLVLFGCADDGAAIARESASKQARASASPHSQIDFNSLNSRIRDGQIGKHEALRQVQIALPELSKYYFVRGGNKSTASEWSFPLEGYGASAIGGVKGDGYVPAGFDFFDGNKHGGHPAHDIFIADRNQDGIDDKTGHPVNVLSVTAGIVIATEEAWDSTSSLRGGKYVWIFDPNSNCLFYYAHNSRLFVHLLDLVKPGDTIATVGRTGFNAFKKRSPTHLHFSQFSLGDGFYPRPVNSYADLVALARRHLHEK